MSGKINIMVGLPCYGGMVTAPTTLSLIRLAAVFGGLGITWSVRPAAGESFIPRARNNIVATFMKSDATHLLFIDADVGFEPTDVLALAAIDKPLVCAPYPVKNIDWKAVEELVRRSRGETTAEELELASSSMAVNPVPGAEDEFIVRDGRTYVKALDGATGFMLISRECFEKMMVAYPETRYLSDFRESKGDEQFALFDSSFEQTEEGPRYLTEDYTFCRRWQKIGGEVWMYVDAKLTHTGTHVFKGDVMREHWAKDTLASEPRGGSDDLAVPNLEAE